jgi:hypothetical protein
MNKQSAPRLLEVAVVAQGATNWRWHISEADVEVAYGFAASRETAQIDGDSALFAMLSEGPK